nr:MAG: nonstructural protein [Phoenicurus auroreus ambidensovirus]
MYSQRYFSRNGRKLLFLKVGYRDRTKDFGNEDVEERGCTGEAGDGMVETCRVSRESNLSKQLTYGTALGPGGRGNQSNSSSRGKRQHDRHEEITNFLLKYPCTPMINVCKTKAWLENDSLMYTREDDSILKTCVDVLQARVATWNIFDFQLLYRKHTTLPLWNSLDVDLSPLYYSVEDSVEILTKFLNFQFQDNRECIVEFLTTVYNVCERKIPKLNSVCVLSEPSGGKNFFFDMILAFYWNKGQLGNPNKNNTFAYQECVNKRILLWNEPNYESAETDMLKMVLGGDNYTAKVKYKNDCAVYRTPVIVLTNKTVPFMIDPAFADRCKVYCWNTCPMLREVGSKPIPVAWIDLLEKYSIL